MLTLCQNIAKENRNMKKECRITVSFIPDSGDCYWEMSAI